MSYEVIRGNALALPIEDESVDLVVTSPPYFALRSYRDEGEHYDGQVGSEASPQEFLEALWAATAEMVRVLKPTGSIFVNLGDKYAGPGGHNNAGLNTPAYMEGYAPASGWDETRNAPKSYNKNSDVGGATVRAKSLMGLPWRYAIGCIDQLGLILRAEIIWSKPNGLPESVTDRVRRSHEQWFCFTKSPRYFSAVDEIREAQIHPQGTQGSGFSERRRNKENTPAFTHQYDQPNPLGKLPGSVWVIPSEPLIIPEHLGLPDHFAAFPQEWPRRLILGWSPSGVCTACGEGRRPVVEKESVGVHHHGNESMLAADRLAIPGKAWRRNSGEEPASVNATITGYACACDVATAPTRPAVVLDPFGGTGTVAGVAHALGRHGISVDLSADYCRLAEWRIGQSGHFQKAYERSAVEGAVVPLVAPKDTADGRLSLFGEAS